MRKGELQQLDIPQRLYDAPVNLFVAEFIGSPAMNLVLARVERAEGAVWASFGPHRLRLDAGVLDRHPGLLSYEGAPLVLGVRPEDMEDAALVSDAPLDRRITAQVELSEALGSDVVVHFTVDAPQALTDDVKELAADVGQEALEHVEQHAARGRANVVARLNPRTTARKGERIELVLDTHRLHFFDPDDGSGIYGRPA
jgi:multiple sugar transport system ATP-binding protein